MRIADDTRRSEAAERHRRLLPVGVIAAVYLVVGTLWIFGGGPVADTITEVTSIPRWVVELGKGLLFIVITTLVLSVSMRRRADRLDVAEARAHDKARQLAASEDRNRLQATALSATANAVVITGADGTIEWVNHAFETMSGYPASVAVGATSRLVGSGLQSEEFYRDLWDTILAGQVWRGQVVNRRSDGELYTISQTITPVVTEDGDVQHFVGIHEDVTERVRAAGELEASRFSLNTMKDTFLQSVSHELRTPLTSIVGFAQLLAAPHHELSPGDTREFHRRILSNAHRLQRLLDDLLDLDRFTRGQIEPNRLPTDLTDLIHRMVHDVDLGDHAIDLDLEAITMGLDAPWVERIVANLLRNIERHTPPDTNVWVRTRGTAGGVELTIDDDGPGIPEADRQRVIEPFQQGTEAAASAQPGTGVGLSLVNNFAQIHGGDLTITDSPAGGARMTVTLAHAATASPGTPTGRVPTG